MHSRVHVISIILHISSPRKNSQAVKKGMAFIITSLCGGGSLHITPRSLTTEPLLSWLFTSLNLQMKVSSMLIGKCYNFINLPMEILEHSMCVPSTK